MPIVPGVGSLIVNDILTDVSYQLFQPIVNTTITDFTVPAGYGDGGFGDGGYGDGTGLVVTVGSVNAMYVGAQVIVGLGLPDEEVVTILEVETGDFVAAFVNAHSPGEIVVGATFPVQSIAGDPLFEQSEMIGYLSEAMNDFLLRVPLVYAVTDAITMPPTAQFTALPADCMQPVRVAANTTGVGLYPFRETSQANLDSMDFRWMNQGNSEPYLFYRDKVGLNNIGLWPRASNTTPLEIVYAQRSAQVLGLADGFVLPDPFLPTIKARVLSTAYGKDGESRSPAMAKWFGDKYENGVKVAGVILEVINDANMQ